tara:strand:+ start:1553 stop:1990 length:438 start_codon:yes stop_codon:yes gene_type:complete
MVKDFEAVSDKSISHKIVDRRPGDIATRYADPEFAKIFLGWQAEFDLAHMCEDSWRWQLNNSNGFDLYFFVDYAGRLDEGGTTVIRRCAGDEFVQDYVFFPRFFWSTDVLVTLLYLSFIHPFLYFFFLSFDRLAGLFLSYTKDLV